MCIHKSWNGVGDGICGLSGDYNIRLCLGDEPNNTAVLFCCCCHRKGVGTIEYDYLYGLYSTTHSKRQRFLPWLHPKQVHRRHRLRLWPRSFCSMVCWMHLGPVMDAHAEPYIYKGYVLDESVVQRHQDCCCGYWPRVHLLCCSTSREVRPTPALVSSLLG